MYIHVIAGCMWSGKSEQLCRLIKRNAVIGRVRVFLAVRDVAREARSLEEMLPKKRNILKPVKIESPADMPRFIGARDKVIVIDEAHFWSPEKDTDEEKKRFLELKEIIQKMKRNAAFADKLMLISGLDRDFRDEPFETMEYLMAISDYGEKLTAVCQKCKRNRRKNISEATCTQRFSDGRLAPVISKRFLVGNNDSYEPRCRKCYEVPQ